MLRTQPTVKKPATARKPVTRTAGEKPAVTTARKAPAAGPPVDHVLRDIRRRGKELTASLNALLVRLG